MKKLLVLTTLVLAAASAAFASETAPVAHDLLVPFGGNVHARIGMTRATLVAQLGEPSEKLGENVWAYWDFRRVGPMTRARGDALVVIFAQERISLLRFTTRVAVESALQQMRANGTKPATIARR